MSATAYEQEDGYQSLQLILQEKFGIVLGDDRRMRMIARLKPVMEEFTITDIFGLTDRLRQNSDEDLRNAVLLAVTSYDTTWFEPAELFALLSDYVLPGLIDKGLPRARVWIVGCGSGVLPYSVSMTVADVQKKSGGNPVVDILATENSETMLAEARLALYDCASMKNLDEKHMHKYMTATGGQFRVNDNLREKLTFSTCNLLDDFSGIGHFDVIICLDTLMYFSLTIKRRILETFSGLLEPSGILLVGASEAVIPLSRKFDRVEIPAGVFYRQKS